MSDTSHSTAAEGVPGLAVGHAAAGVGRLSFGIGAAVLPLVQAQRALGADAEIWSCDDPAEAPDLCRRYGLPDDRFATFPVFGPRRYGWSYTLLRAAPAAARFAVLHQHGMWTGVSRFCNRWRSAWRRPTVVAPHGSLAAVALQRSRWKKWLALRAYQRSNLTGAACLHALSETEAQQCRDFGLRGPVAVIPNGVSRAWLESTGAGERFRRHFGLPDDRRLALFLGRVTPIKGLSRLIDAVASCTTQRSDWLVLIAGPDEFGHLDELRGQVARLQLEAWVRFVGPLYDPLRRDAFAAASLFLLPSYSEASPIAAYEAMGAGLPLLTTTAAPFPTLGERGCGWWAPNDTPGIAAALAEALARPPQELAAMGGRARELVETTYTWEIAARKTLALYHWLLGEAPQPPFVLLS